MKIYRFMFLKLIRPTQMDGQTKVDETNKVSVSMYTKKYEISCPEGDWD